MIIKDKQIKKIIEELVATGWSLISKNNHIKMKRGCEIIIVPSTPSDRRAYLNLKSLIKRYN